MVTCNAESLCHIKNNTPPPPYIRKTTPINLSRQVIEYVTNC